MLFDIVRIFSIDSNDYTEKILLYNGDIFSLDSDHEIMDFLSTWIVKPIQESTLSLTSSDLGLTLKSVYSELYAHYSRYNDCIDTLCFSGH